MAFLCAGFKDLHQIFPSAAQKRGVLVVDDREDVWPQRVRGHLIKASYWRGWSQKESFRLQTLVGEIRVLQSWRTFWSDLNLVASGRESKGSCDDILCDWIMPDVK